LIEQSSTNTILYSQNFGNANWLGGTLVANITADIAPDGTQTASLVYPTTTGTYTFYQVVVATGTSQTYSIYAKKYSGATIANAFILRNQTTATNLIGGTIDYDTGVVTQTVGSGGITSTSVGNGWWRISMSVSSGITVGNNLACYAGYVGGTYTANTGAYFWGAQLEALAFPTSYIKTDNAQVIRASDNASMTGTNFSSWYNQGQGTFYTESSTVDTTPTVFGIGDATPNNRIQIGLGSGGGQGLRSFVIVNGVQQNNIQVGTYTTGSYAKTALSATSGSFTGAFNGTLSSTFTGTMPVCTQAGIGQGNYLGVNYQNGRIKKLAYYPQALTSAQLQALTT